MRTTPPRDIACAASIVDGNKLMVSIPIKRQKMTILQFNRASTSLIYILFHSLCEVKVFCTLTLRYTHGCGCAKLV